MVDFDSPGKEERIAVGPQLSLSVWDSEPGSAAPGARPSPAALLDGHLLNTLSDDRSVRLPLMAASSLLVLAAFVLCNERTAKRHDAENSSGRAVGTRGSGWPIVIASPPPNP